MEINSLKKTSNTINITEGSAVGTVSRLHMGTISMNYRTSIDNTLDVISFLWKRDITSEDLTKGSIADMFYIGDLYSGYTEGVDKIMVASTTTISFHNSIGLVPKDRMIGVSIDCSGLAVGDSIGFSAIVYIKRGN